MKKYYQIVVVLTLITEIIFFLIRKELPSLYWDDSFLVIPPFFMGVEISYCLLVRRYSDKGNKVTCYMIYKMSKIMVSLIILGLYMYLVNISRIGFLLIFGLSYLIFLFAETWIFLDYQKHKKEIL